MSTFQNFYRNIIRTEVGDIFPYYTVKVAKIKDWRLGLSYWFVLAFTIAYILWNLFRNSGYMKFAPPIAGSVYTSLALVGDGATGGVPVPNYCANLPAGINGCFFWTPQQAVFPYQGELDSMFITTRVRNKTFPARRDANGALCNYQQPTTAECFPPQFSDSAPNVLDTYYFVANVEQMSIQINHAVRAQYLNGFLGLAYQLWEGRNLEGNMLRNCDPNDIAVTFNHVNQSDRITLGDLIANAGCDGAVSLDGLSTSASATPGVETWRGSGMVISVPIIYRNRGLVESGTPIKYSYVPAVIPSAEFKTTEKFYNSDGSITYYDRHGVKIVFAQAGQLGQFDIQSLLVSVVGGLALVSLARLIVDFFMIYVVKRKEVFGRMKYESHDGVRSSDNGSSFTGPSDSGFVQPTRVGSVLRDTSSSSGLIKRSSTAGTYPPGSAAGGDNGASTTTLPYLQPTPTLVVQQYNSGPQQQQQQQQQSTTTTTTYPPTTYPQTTYPSY